MLSKSDRLQEFLRRLDAAEPASSAEGALELVSQMLNAVEDELTDIPFDPSSWMDDGRLYPPQADSAFRVPDHPDLIRYRNRDHNTIVSKWGAIEIRTASGEVILEKPGASGKGVWK